MNLRLSRLAVAAALAVALLIGGATDAFATHFRYGTITWQADPAHPWMIKIRFDAAWRWSFEWPSPQGQFASACPGAPFVPTGPTGPGACPPVGRLVYAAGGANNGRIVITGPPGSGYSQTISAVSQVRTINSAEDWMTTSMEATVSLPATPGLYEISYENGDRISTLIDGNANAPYRITSQLTLRLPPDAINQPPTVATLPIIRVPMNESSSFPIPASDPNGDPITFSVATNTMSGLVNALPNGMSLNQSSGLVTFTPPNPGLYAVQFAVRDSYQAMTVVDLLVEARNIAAPGEPPSIKINGLKNAQLFNTMPGNTTSFAVDAVDPEGSSVMLVATGVPPGSIFTPSLPLVAVNASSTFTWTPPPGSTGTYIVNFSALDADGRQSLQTATIQVANNPPTAICPAPPGPFQATGPGGALAGVGANVSDADGDLLTVRIFIDGVEVAVSGLLSPPAGFGTPPAWFPVGTHGYEVRVSDGLSAPATCAGSFEVVDTVAPVIAVPADVTLPATSADGAAHTFTVTATDIVDAAPAIDCSPASGSIFPHGATTVVCTATDASGNSATGSFIVTITDVTPPEMTATVSGAIGDNNWYTGDVTIDWAVTDGESAIASSTGCATTVLDVDTAGVQFTCSATNAAALTGSATTVVLRRDATAPVVTHAVAAITAEAAGAAGATVTFDAPAVTDAMSGIATWSCTHESGSTFPLGLTVVTCSATDAAGNAGSADLAVMVVDTTAPAIGAPTGASAEATGPGGAAVSFATPAATDTVDANVSVSCVPASGSTFALGTTTVACTATDDSGNAATATMTVTVTDSTPPAIGALPDITVNGTNAVSWLALATDVVSGDVPVSCSPASGSVFVYGTTLVTCDAVDAAGNSATASFNVMVTDATPPVVVASTTGATGANGWYVGDVSITFTVTDPESPVTATGCDPVTVTVDGSFTIVCSATSEGGTGTATAAGNRDATPPALTVPGNVAVTATGASTIVSYPPPSAGDAGSGLASVSCTPASGSAFAVGTTTVGCAALDNAGNSASATFIVSVADTTPPVVASIAPSINVLSPPNHQMVPITITVLATDDLDPAPVCSVLGVSSNEPQNGLGDGDTPNDWLLTGGLTLQLRAERSGQGTGRIYTVTVRCVDAAGNSATTTTTVTVPRSQRSHAEGDDRDDDAAERDESKSERDRAERSAKPRREGSERRRRGGS